MFYDGSVCSGVVGICVASLNLNGVIEIRELFVLRQSDKKRFDMVFV